MTARFDRRRFVQFASAVTAGTLVFAEGLQAASSIQASAADGGAIMLKPASGDLYRVRMETTVKGSIHLPKDPLLSKKMERQVPLAADSVLDFEERITRDSNEKPVAARRYYYTATSEAKVNGEKQATELRKDAKRVIARLAEGPAVVYAEREYLTHEEVELLQEPICSLSINGLLPVSAISVGSKWQPSQTDLAQVLNLDGVMKSTVEGEVVSIDSESVKLLFKGQVDAAVLGVPTVIDLAGKMTFERTTDAITWFAVAIREKRDIGLSKPGFEIAATIKFIRQPLLAANAVRDTTAIDIASPAPEDKLLVQYRSEVGNFATFLDRRWRTLSSSAGLTTIRMIENNSALAQCDIRELPKMKSGEQLTLEAFQAEIKKSLGTRFGEFLEAEEGLNSTELRTMRAVAAGIVQDVPVQWVFLHFSDDYGRRVAATFTVEAKNVATFGGSDAQLANSFEFLKPQTPAQASVPKSVLDR